MVADSIAPALMLAAWAMEASVGWPSWLFRYLRHPVVWLGWMISTLEHALNRPAWPHPARRAAGALTTFLTVALAAGFAGIIAAAFPPTWWGFAFEALAASSLLASRSLFHHVAAVARPLANGDADSARAAVSMIVGRDPQHLDEAGMVRAAMESLAENASDGVVAPVFWGAVLGLPGLAAYKAINTLDSMIGHRNETCAAFGNFAARLDDVANFAPARLTGLLIAVASLRSRAFVVAVREAGRHRSPNAGWPEAAMAGGLGVRLSGPRAYGDMISQEPWLNGEAADPTPADMRRGLRLYCRAMMLGAVLLAVTAWAFIR